MTRNTWSRNERFERAYSLRDNAMWLSLIEQDSLSLIINQLDACRQLSNVHSVRAASAFARKKPRKGVEAVLTGVVHMRDLKVEELSHVYGAGGKGGCGGKGGSKGGSKGKSHKSKSHKSKAHKSKCR
jgi:hypothetical protein